ncbi:DUF5677 domain-containing protein [Pseudomonas sp. MWU12-2345]|uniref:DUF5677 domain-containing protein n=1 Tax=Pseudomonas sp. MWU12-2345 TaxID=2928689 RepID=UPI00200ECB18|nr:DUF5677 domain-containing protein [Pseudomonas sp. MWU12-2345]
MTFDQNGFTGPSGVSIRIKQLQDYEELFNFAKECSQLAVEMTQLPSDSTHKIKLIASLFFARSTSHFQAAICLAEGGMTIEALVLCRSLLETFFVLNALADGVVTPEELVSHDGASRKSHANALLNKINTYENVAPFVETLREFVTEKAGAVEIKLYEFARKSNALAVYDGLYRHLSHNAAHPSLSAVDPYLMDMPNGLFHAQFRPIFDYTPRAVLSACTGILLSCFACDKIGISTPLTNAEITKLQRKFEVLYSAYDPWN